MQIKKGKVIKSAKKRNIKKSCKAFFYVLDFSGFLMFLSFTCLLLDTERSAYKPAVQLSQSNLWHDIHKKGVIKMLEMITGALIFCFGALIGASLVCVNMRRMNDHGKENLRS